MQTELANASPATVNAGCEAALPEAMELVHNIARKFRARVPQQVALEDLVQAGAVGLLMAMRSYDERRKVPFAAYAQFRIRGAILDSLRESDWAPRSLRKHSRELANATQQLSSELSRHPDDDELARYMHTSTESVRRLREVTETRFISIEEQPADGESEHFANTLTTPDPDPLACCLQSERDLLVRHTLEELPERERAVVTKYYYEHLTMNEIAEHLGISEGRVSQLHSRALLMLRGSLSPATNAGNKNLGEMQADNKARKPTRTCNSLRSERRALVAKALEHLPDRERSVIRKYYIDKMTMKQIGGDLGVSVARVSQLHSSALNRILQTNPPGSTLENLVAHNSLMRNPERSAAPN